MAEVSTQELNAPEKNQMVLASCNLCFVKFYTVDEVSEHILLHQSDNFYKHWLGLHKNRTFYQSEEEHLEPIKMSEYYREKLLKENLDSRKAKTAWSSDLTDNKSNEGTQNDDNKNFKPRIICKKDAEYAVKATKVSTLPGLDKEIAQLDPKVQIHCKGMNESSNDSIEIQSELDFKRSKPTLRGNFVLEGSAFPKHDIEAIDQFSIIKQKSTILPILFPLSFSMLANVFEITVFSCVSVFLLSCGLYLWSSDARK